MSEPGQDHARVTGGGVMRTLRAGLAKARAAGAGLIATALPQLFGAGVALITVRVYSQILRPVELGRVMLVLGGWALLDVVYSAAVKQTAFFLASKPGGLWILLERLRADRGRTAASSAALLIVAGVLVRAAADWTYVGLALCLAAYVLIETRRAESVAILGFADNRVGFGWQTAFDAAAMALATSLALYASPDPARLLWASTAARLTSLLFSGWLVRRRRIHGARANAQQPDRAGLPAYFRSMMAMGAVGWLFGFLDRYLVASAGGVAIAGIYAITVGLVGRPYNVLGAALSTQFRPGLFSGIAADDRAQAVRAERRWFGSAAVLGIVGALCFLVAARPVVQLLLAARYRGSALPLLPVLAVAFTCTMLSHVFDNRIMAEGRGRTLLMIQMAGIPVAAAALSAGAYWGGAVGAVWGRLLSEMFRLGMVAALAARTSGRRG